MKYVYCVSSGDVKTRALAILHNIYKMCDNGINPYFTVRICVTY